MSRESDTSSASRCRTIPSFSCDIAYSRSPTASRASAGAHRTRCRTTRRAPNSRPTRRLFMSSPLPRARADPDRESRAVRDLARLVPSKVEAEAPCHPSPRRTPRCPRTAAVRPPSKARESSSMSGAAALKRARSRPRSNGRIPRASPGRRLSFDIARPVSRADPVGYPPLVWRLAPLQGRSPASAWRHAPESHHSTP